MARATCLCGAVEWELDEPFDLASHCHCSRCRKAHGAAFATYVAGAAAGFHLRGREHVVRWQSSPDLARCFCDVCGSVVPGDAHDGRMFVPAGNFDGAPGVSPLAHIFVASKAPWIEIRDGLPQFDGYPPGFDVPVVADRAPVDAAGVVRGSCLCGAIAYVLDAPPSRAHNCYCSRCRKARSAAFASNLVTAADGVRFTRGADQRVGYTLPGAQRFGQVFCRTCGSPLPGIDRARDVAVVPMGSLDDDPGIRPSAHIFVASKAAWVEISDDLPQFLTSRPAS